MTTKFNDEERAAMRVMGLPEDVDEFLIKGALEGPGGKLSDCETQIGKLPMIGNFPHIEKNIRELWGTSHLPGYLKRLLNDSRHGSREGLPLVLASELMVLAEALEKASPPESTSSQGQKT